MANYCSQCGRKLSGSENFCPDCGSKIDKNRSSVSTKDVNELLKEVEPLKEVYKDIKDDIQNMYKDIPDDTDEYDFDTIGGIEDNGNAGRPSARPEMKTINPRGRSSSDERVIGMALLRVLGVLDKSAVLVLQNSFIYR